MNTDKIEKFANRKDAQVKRLLKLFDNKKTIPTFFDLPDYVDFAERIDRTIKFIKKSKDARLIILETWLIIDYSVRHILNYGLEIDKFCDENLSILPQGFRDCTKLLSDLIKNQKAKAHNPSKDLIYLPYEFKMAMLDDKEFLNRFIQHEAAYYRKYNISLAYDYSYLRNNKFRNVDESWLKAVEKLDADWFKKADKLNKVRNFAIHSFDVKRVYIELGINGKNQLAGLRKYCIQSLMDLLGIRKS